MTPCFADTFCFLAMLNRNDEAHAKAVALFDSLRRPIVTTGWVLTELGDALANTSGRRLFGPFVEKLRSDPRALVIPMTDELLDRGIKLYYSRPDHGWSLTDCISFLVMQERGMKEALTGDHHFEQAGFVALLK